jgi:Major tropism determinant N-terminal domain
MANRIQLRRDTASNWSTVNPTLADGEPGLEFDTGKIKYGDGSTAWLDLSYSGFSASGIVFGNWDGWPTIFNDLNNEYTGVQLQTMTPFYDNDVYGRSTLSWHDSGNYSNYTHVQADPYGASIRIADWTGNLGSNKYYWEFQNDGSTRFPNGLLIGGFDGEANLSTDYQYWYGNGVPDGQNTGVNFGNGPFGQAIQLQSTTRWANDSDYGRATLSWHDYDFSNYTHIMADPFGASIRIGDWSGNTGRPNSVNWAFNNDGTTQLPGALSINNGNQEVFGLTTSGYNQNQTTVTNGYLQVSMDSSSHVLIASTDPTGHPFQVAYTGTFTNVSTGATTAVGNSYLVCSIGSPSFTVTDYSSNPIIFANRGDTLVLNVQLADLGRIYRVTVIATDRNNTYVAGNSSIIIEQLV